MQNRRSFFGAFGAILGGIAALFVGRKAVAGEPSQYFMNIVESTAPIKFAAIAATTLGDNTLKAAVTGKKIRVLSLALVASGGANSIRFESAAGGTALTGVMDIVADGQLVLPHNPTGWFQTIVSELLNLELSAATAVGGFFTYQEVL